MFITDNIILLEMPKTGSSFMRRFMNFYFGHGNIEKIGIHNAITDPKLLKRVQANDIVAVGIIRNPFDWYVSSYTYMGQSRVGNYSDVGLRRWGLDKIGIKSMVKNPGVIFRDLTQWREVFAGDYSPELFRKWLKLILEGQPQYLNPKYGYVSKWYGFYSYQFLRIHTQGYDQHYRQIETDGSSMAYYKKHEHKVLYLRSESLQEDLLSNCELLGLDRNKAEETLIEMKEQKGSLRVNKSDRKHYSEYYDEETKALVLEKDKGVMEYFDYTF